MIKSKKERHQFAVIGMGRFGSALTKALFEAGMDVLAIDKNPQKANAIAEYSTHSAIGDASDEAVMQKLGIQNFDAVIICMGSNIQSSILATLNAKELGVPYIAAKASDLKHRTVLEKMGADYVVVPEMDMAKKLAGQLINPYLNDVIELSKDYQIVEIAIPEVWAGQSLIELDLRRKFGVSILMIKHGEGMFANPIAETQLSVGDVAIIGGHDDDVARLMTKIAK